MHAATLRGAAVKELGAFFLRVDRRARRIVCDVCNLDDIAARRTPAIIDRRRDRNYDQRLPGRVTSRCARRGDCCDLQAERFQTSFHDGFGRVQRKRADSEQSGWLVSEQQGHGCTGGRAFVIR